MTYIAIAVLLAWAITAALFVVGARISHARDSRARAAARLVGRQRPYGAGSGTLEKCSGE